MSPVFDSTYIDIFDIDGLCEQLTNFAIGMLAIPEVERSLLECLSYTINEDRENATID